MKRAAIVTMMAAAMPLAACSKAENAQKNADANAAGFVPPSVLSRLDYGSTVERRFHALDRNSDQKLDASELPRRDSRLMALDLDHDGTISVEEWGEGMIARFDRLDANHDGTVTSEERQAAKRAR